MNLELSESPDPQWNKRILLSKLGRYLQTTEHAKFLHSTNNYKPMFVYFKNGEKIVGQQLLFLRPRGTTLIKKTLGKLIKPYYFWKNSILIFDNNFQEEILQQFTSFIKDKKFIGTDNPLADYYLNLPSTKIGTVILEIKKTFDETISERDPTSTQKHIAESAKLGIPTKKGVIIKEMKTKSDVDNYIKILNIHREKLGIEKRIPERAHDFFKVLQNGFGGGLLAYHNEKPISGILYTIFNGWIQNMGVANTEYSVKNKLSSLDYIRCWLIAKGVKSQANYFDFSGISVDPKNKKEEGIRHSQTKWGGKVVLLNRYSNV